MDYWRTTLGGLGVLLCCLLSFPTADADEDEQARFVVINGTDQGNFWGDPARDIYVFEWKGTYIGCGYGAVEAVVAPGARQVFRVPVGEKFTYFIGFSPEHCKWRWKRVVRGDGKHRVEIFR